ncbi:hypothetical protein BDV93DRAFT_193817 [Ceratobasidium sp. AG-I]|nr:hypothetical protein BDV93DRAFT_193817 [Ceratobasidium sp. AG-I]
MLDYDAESVISGHQNRWTSLHSHLSERAILPSLLSLEISLMGPDHPYQDILRWTDILVPPTLSDFSCVTTANSPTQSIWPLVQLVLSRCIHLLRFELAVGFDSSGGNIHEYWDLLLSQDPPIHLRNLVLDLPVCDNRSLSWVAKMSELEDMTVRLSNLPGIQNPVESPQELRSLNVTSDSPSAIIEFWRTSMTLHLTSADIRYWGAIMDTEISLLFEALAAHSPLLNDLQFWFRPLLSHDNLARLCPLPIRNLRIPGAVFDPTIPSPFRAIADFWPNLERLDIESTPIALDDLVCISRHLPQLRELAVWIPGGFTLGAIRAPRLSLVELETQRALWLSHSFYLSPRSSFNGDYENLDNIAPILAMTWPNMNISRLIAWNERLKEMIDYYSPEVLQNGYVDREIEVLVGEQQGTY